MGLRFQRRLRLLPGVRLNLSKSGLSASIGPRGADVNIGPHGVTTNAGIPGTGLSYRSKLGTRGGGIALLAIAVGLGFWAFQHSGNTEKTAARPAPAVQTRAAVSAPDLRNGTDGPGPTAREGIVRYVHRGGSVLRASPKAHGKTLKKEVKGAMVTVLSQTGDGWARVADGPTTGWMRISVLGENPPR